MNFHKGSEWRKWDLHIHSNASDGKSTVEDIIKEAKAKDLSVIALTDHHTAKNIDKLKQLAKDENFEVISGIEFRSELGAKSVHFIGLFPEYFKETPLTSTALHDLVLSPLSLSETKIISKGKESKQGLDNEHAFKEGMFLVQVDFKKAAKLIHEIGGLVVVHNGSKSNGMESEIKHKGNSEKNVETLYDSLGTLKEELMKEYIDICEISKENDSEDFYLTTFNKPSIIASDAHKTSEIGTKFVWIKADPTFDGLKQILYEPKDRVFIGERPEVLNRVENDKTKYIESLFINQNPDYDESKGVWFKDINISLNKELVCIIGNKGSGKSALSDIIGLLGNTHNSGFNNSNFSFLNDRKFLQKGLANNFYGTLEWADKNKVTVKLGDTTNIYSVEKIRYLPQSYFDTLTNSLDGEGFQETLENVIFEHLPEQEKHSKFNFKDLKEYKIANIEKDIAKLGEELHQLNIEIIALEEKMHPNFKINLESNLATKANELLEHKKIHSEIVVIEEPFKDDESIKEKSEQFTIISKFNERIKDIDHSIETKNNERKTKVEEIEELNQLLYGLERIENEINDYKTENEDIYKQFALDINDVLIFEIKKGSIKNELSYREKSVLELNNILMTNNEIEMLLSAERDEVEKVSLYYSRGIIEKSIEDIKKELNEKESAYQSYTEKIAAWNMKEHEIIGDENRTGSLKFFQKQLDNLSCETPQKLEALKAERISTSKEIFEKKSELINLFNKFKEPVANQVSKNRDYLKGYDINIGTSFNLIDNFSSKFFDYINQGKKGSFYGIEDGEKALNMIIKEKDFNSFSAIETILNDIMEHLKIDKRKNYGETRYIVDQIEDIEEFYDYIFSLEYLIPMYELKLGEKQLSELSPGEKGTLLLVFYLMIDKELIPLVIDQPEDNLDNQSVYTMLREFIKQAKKKRQIIIVTHNPNLAVGADAEQVIHVSIDKKNNRFNFSSGAIEKPEINKIIVDILEGTMPAFDKRKLKYS